MQRSGGSVLGSKACATCFKAKVRCEAGQGAAACERCERLNKRCIVEPRKIRRPNRTTAGGLSKTDIHELRSKVESLEQLFSATFKKQEVERGSPSHEASVLETSSPGREQVVDDFKSLQLSPTSKEGEEALIYFQERMTPMFPSVVVPATTTPSDLARHKPMLWTAIGLVARGQDDERRSASSKVFMSEVSRRIFVDQERSLDLLQGILVYTAWNHLHQATLAVSLWSPLLHTAIALMSDLNLDEEPGNIRAARTGLGALKQFEQPAEPLRSERTLDERRALIGIFLLSSISSTCLRDIFGLPSFLALQRSRQILQSTKQYHSDSCLAHMLQIQQVADSIRSILYRGFLEAEPISPEAVFAAFRSLQVSVQNLESELEGPMSQQPLLTMASCSLRIYLYKISLDDRLFDSANFDEDREMLAFQTPNHTRPSRGELLGTVSRAAQRLVEEFCRLDTIVCASLPYLAWIQLGHAILMLSRVVTASHEFGDFILFFESLSGFRDGIEQLARKMEDVTTGKGQEPAGPQLPLIFGKIPAKLGEIREIVEATVESQIAAASFAGSWGYSGDMFGPLEMDDIDWA
ncbi:hypothetical protein LIA77_08734 [Sarocladium implicatum]|nr:hypothetical protein LIA77_08734 [Sarocladium implicatum]